MRTLLVPATLLLFAATAAAQPAAPAPGGGRPTFSPYLNLLRGAGSGSAGPALNYFGLVRPQVEARLQGQALQQQIGQTNQAVAGLNSQVQAGQQVDPSQFFTGRGATYMNYSHYYPGLGGGGGVGMAGGRAGGGMAPRVGGGGSGLGRIGGGAAGAGAAGGGAMRGGGGARR